MIFVRKCALKLIGIEHYAAASFPAGIGVVFDGYFLWSLPLLIPSSTTNSVFLCSSLRVVWRPVPSKTENNVQDQWLISAPNRWSCNGGVETPRSTGGL